MSGSYMEDLAESFTRDIDSAKPLPPLSVLCLSCHLGLSFLILCHSDLPVVNSYVVICVEFCWCQGRWVSWMVERCLLSSLPVGDRCHLDFQVKGERFLVSAFIS